MNKSERDLLLRRALGCWDNEGGATTAGPQQDVHSGESGSNVPPLTNAELVRLQVRVIALENLVIALLAGGSVEQRRFAGELASWIAPRPGFTRHPLTIHAAAQMVHILGRSEVLRADAGKEVRKPPRRGYRLHCGDDGG